ncbi:unnamed protein product [Calypogeia fissa]
MSSNVLVIDEEDENGQPPASASHSSCQGLGNDEKIDIESQRPSTSSGNDDEMASSSDPMASSSDPDNSPLLGHSRQGEAFATAILATESSGSSQGGSSYPVIINLHLPSSPPMHERQDGGEPEDSNSTHHAVEKPRDSWDYHADDSFEIEKEVAISEVEQEVALAYLPPVAELDSEPEQQQQNHHGVASHDRTPLHDQQQEEEEDRATAQQDQIDQIADEIALEIRQQQQQPPTVPTITRIKSEFRQKLNLSDLILPSAGDDLPEPLSEAGVPNESIEGELGETSPNDSVIGDLPLLTSRRKPPRPTLYRVKTRLQDPPPMTPAVSDQLASLWSDAGTRSRRNSAIPPSGEDDGGGGGGQQAWFGPMTSRRVSMVRQPSGVMQEEELHAQPRFGSSVSRKSVSSGGGDANAAGGAPPAAAPSRLGLFSPSRLGLLSPSRIGLFSKSKANLATPPDEEKDPLDDDAIPTYKKKKKKQRIWLIAFQWSFLAALIVVLVFAVKFRKLKMVVWRDIALWQWLALAIVVVSGRLIAGWCVMLLVALIERHYILKKRVLYFVYGLRHAVKNCIWLALVIGVWKLVFKHIQEEDKTNSTNIVTRVLWCLFTTSALWMVKILAVKVAANSFHRAAYFDRVQDCLFHQYVLETLSSPRVDDPHWSTSNRGSREESPSHGFGRRAAELQQEHQRQQVSTSKHSESRSGFPRLEHLRSLEKLATTAEEEPTRPTISLARAPSRTFLEPSPSRRNLTSSSRMNLGATAPYATPSQLHSPVGRRRVSYTEPTPILARSSVPIGQEKLQELTSETVSAWTLKRLMKMIRKTNIATFSSILEKEVGDTIDSEAQAKSAAKQIFYNIARPGEKFLSLSDFLYFLPEEQATRAFGLFELNDAGHITKKSLMKWVVNVYKERRSLALTLSDNRTVVAKLHRVLDVLLLGIAITICFLIMGVNTQKLLVAFSSVLLPSVFVFGNAARSTFESLIFLFVMHPFDVGDRINVDGNAMIVEEMNILNTILLSGSNEKIYYPNSVLATKAISNYYRSPDQWDSIEFQIHSGTPVEQLGLLKERMTKYIEGLPQFWYPVFRIVCKDIEDSTRMKMALWIQHHLNYQESGERWQRRSNMILHMKTQLEELGIGFHLPRQEVTVTGIPVLDVPAPRQATPMY